MRRGRATSACEPRRAPRAQGARRACRGFSRSARSRASRDGKGPGLPDPVLPFSTAWTIGLAGWTDKGAGGSLSTGEETHGGVDGDHLVVVREVGVEGAVQGERFRVGVECSVGLGVILDGLACEPREELVDVADALDGTERLTVTAPPVRLRSTASMNRTKRTQYRNTCPNHQSTRTSRNHPP